MQTEGFSGRTTNKMKSSMPDIATDSDVTVEGLIDRVGMTDVEVPIRVKRSDGVEVMSAGWADAFVSLDDPKTKGIHMSRLYLGLIESLEAQPLTRELLEKTVRGFVESHKEMSRSAYLRLRFDFMTLRKSLLSENLGWRSYPVCIESKLSASGEIDFSIQAQVSYSSTCPCSAALARQLISERFQEDYKQQKTISTEEVSDWLLKEESICATPHSQRSYATVKVALGKDSKNFEISHLISLVEASLGTAVQAAVKREDEQEFARLNGRNLMFCEDAARRIKSSFEKVEDIVDYHIEAKHVESLHPHNAVSVIVKGVEGGFRP